MISYKILPPIELALCKIVPFLDIFCGDLERPKATGTDDMYVDGAGDLQFEYSTLLFMLELNLSQMKLAARRIGRDQPGA